MRRPEPTAALLFLLISCSGGGDAPSVDEGRAATPAEAAAEERAYSLVNDERNAQALADLVHDQGLRVVARLHSQDMVARAFFSHTNPDGLSPFDRMAARGMTFRSAGENIAWNVGYSDPAATAVSGWMNSSGHRANILDTSFTHTGVGVAETPGGAWYFTQVFTLPGTSTLLLRGWWHEELAEPIEDGAISSYAVDIR